jgi:uncharacterized YigZ family protein
MEDEYRTIVRAARTEIKVQGSRFIGEAMPALTVQDASVQLDAIRKREYAASHHCSAYRVGHEGTPTFKYSDDGEPNGTAGRPIYDAITGAHLTDTLVVVTRYFGGTKLGTGGLAHAYADSAALALEEAGAVTKFLTLRARCTLDFSQYNRWLRLIQKSGATVIESQFGTEVITCIEIRRSRFDDLRKTFIELTAGKGRFEALSPSPDN